MSDNSEMRDIGPYQNADQAMRQFANWGLGIPLPTQGQVSMLLREALLMVGVEPSEFEAEYVRASEIDPIMATIVHGWILRAHLGDRPTGL